MIEVGSQPVVLPVSEKERRPTWFRENQPLLTAETHSERGTVLKPCIMWRILALSLELADNWYAL
jgi:hypothetical protein